MKRNTILFISLCGLMLGQIIRAAAISDSNSVNTDPNKKGFWAFGSDPNDSFLATAKPVSGTLAMGWLHQGKKSPPPLVGQEDVTFRIERYPWPYAGYFNNDYFAGPWFYDPWHRYHWGYWRYYSNDYWRHHHNYHLDDYHNWRYYQDAYTYPINYVEMQMKLNENTSLNFGVSFIYDYLYW